MGNFSRCKSLDHVLLVFYQPATPPLGSVIAAHVRRGWDAFNQMYCAHKKTGSAVISCKAPTAGRIESVFICQVRSLHTIRMVRKFRFVKGKNLENVKIFLDVANKQRC